MDVYMSIQEMIGSTPMLKLNHIGVKSGVNVYAKLELMNPAGSVKDRIGVYMLKDAEDRGLLKPGGTIIEATAGNTGIGIALAALNKGYRVIFTVPRKFSVEKQKIRAGKKECPALSKKRSSCCRKYRVRCHCSSSKTLQILSRIMK